MPGVLLLGDTGVISSTADVVAAVGAFAEASPVRFTELATEAERVAIAIRDAVAGEDPGPLGPLMDRNHALLQEVGASSAELDRLVGAAREAGALGAKLTGGGGGGHMMAWCHPPGVEPVRRALVEAGATGVIEVRFPLDPP